MKRFLAITILAAILLNLFGCATIKPIPIETIIQYETRDSLILRDSTVITPKERIVDVVPAYDSLRLETSMAFARAWVDTTTHTLKGSIENKDGVQYKYVDREKIVYKDRIVYKDVPVPVEVEKTIHPKYEKWLWVWSVLSVVLIGLFIYIKIRH